MTNSLFWRTFAHSWPTVRRYHQSDNHVSDVTFMTCSDAILSIHDMVVRKLFKQTVSLFVPPSPTLLGDSLKPSASN